MEHLRTRLALLFRELREQRGWSQAEFGRRFGKPQSVVSRLEDPDYGRLSLQTIFEVAAAYDLPVYIDLPNWDEWFRLTEDMSSRNLRRQAFDFDRLIALGETSRATRHRQVALLPLGQNEMAYAAPYLGGFTEALSSYAGGVPVQLLVTNALVAQHSAASVTAPVQPLDELSKLRAENAQLRRENAMAEERYKKLIAERDRKINELNIAALRNPIPDVTASERLVPARSAIPAAILQQVPL
jgi:transcriptional regulator with XRE-family HTH domain